MIDDGKYNYYLENNFVRSYTLFQIYLFYKPLGISVKLKNHTNEFLEINTNACTNK